MRVMLLGNQSRSMSIFWRVLIRRLQERGAGVSICVPAGDESSDVALVGMRCKLIHYRLDRKGLDPIRDLQTVRDLRAIFKREKPDILFATTIKPVIYGCLSAKGLIPHIYATITGLGYAFETDSLFKKAVNLIGRTMYRFALANAEGIFFQNTADAAVFREQGILAKNDPRILYAAGTGVDTDYFKQYPIPAGDPVFLLIGRLLEAKGIRDYASAAEMLKEKYPDAKFQVLGPEETGPGRLDPEVLRNSALDYLGEARDVRPYLEKAHVVVLPSWREGLSTALMEAMSCGRPVIATDVPGCRDLIKNGFNGFLVAPRNPESLAAGMEKFLLKPELVATMGQKSRELAVASYDANVVANQIIDALTGKS